ncbi:MAG: hypothetical protein AAFR47_12605 [Pseudomonadota bacterium]
MTRFRTGLTLIFVAIAGPLAAEWQSSSDTGRGWAQASTTVEGVYVQMACSRSTEPQLQFYGYEGPGLERVDDATSMIRIEIAGADGAILYADAAPFYYFAPDQTWLSQYGTAPPYLGAWAQGSSMAIVGSGGERIAEVALTGTSRALAAMRTACNL